jgi:hypothetical protein
MEPLDQVNPPPKPVQLRDRLNQVKDRKGIPDRKDDEGRKIKCFRCQELGHHQKDCVNLPICYKCKEEGIWRLSVLNFMQKLVN